MLPIFMTKNYLIRNSPMTRLKKQLKEQRNKRETQNKSQLISKMVKLMIQIKRDLTRKGISTRKDTQMTKAKDQDKTKEDLSMETFNNNRNQVMCQHTVQIQVWLHQLFKDNHMVNNRPTWLLRNTCHLNNNSNSNNSSNSTNHNQTSNSNNKLLNSLNSNSIIQIKHKEVVQACNSTQLQNNNNSNSNSKEANNNNFSNNNNLQ